PVECKIEHGRDGRLLADQKGSRIYMKYTANRVQHSEITVTSQHGGDPAIMLIMCRDRYSLPLPFEDILAMSREMADSSACRGKLLTNKTDYFLIGGTFASNAFDKYEIAEGLVSGLRFAVGHSKTIDEVALELQRGSGIANSVIGHGVQSIDTKTTRQARYSVIYRNDSPDVFEHGIMMMAVFDR
ncbi:MAG: hypothetical protein J6Y01_05175, partial [Spirochaetales bacterium]|nr:hypothetical protein [Spirochaetales bacterium]